MNEGRQTSAAAKSANKTAETLPAKTATAPTLPPEVARRGISEAIWRTLMNSLYPGAAGESVLMVVDYCIARKLDPMKKPCHIVPMNVKDAKSGQWGWRDVVMPGIYELRTTAMRTGVYMGHSTPLYGDPIEYGGVTAPEWCEQTFYRWHELSMQRIEFTVRTFFRECVGTKKDGSVNDRWRTAPVQMLTKCNEAAGLREAFPDELGGQHTEEELAYKPILAADQPPEPTRKPEVQAPRERAPEPAAQPAAIKLKPRDALLRVLDQTGISEAAICEKYRVGHIDELGDDDMRAAATWASTVNG